MLPTVTRSSCCRPRPAIDGVGIHRFFGSYGLACDACQRLMRIVPEGAIIDPDVGVLMVDAPDDDVEEAVVGLQAAGARGVLNTLFLQMFDVAPRVASLMPETMRAARHKPSDRMMPVVSDAQDSAFHLEVAHHESWLAQPPPPEEPRWSANERVVVVPRSVSWATRDDGSTLLIHNGPFPGRVMHYDSMAVRVA
jgi:hypothetical protein